MAAANSVTSGVYVILCLCVKSAYIGESANLAQRKSHHFNPNHPHDNPQLRQDMTTHGINSFTFLVLETIKTKQARLVAEKKWFDHYQANGYTMYNLKAGGKKGGMYLAPALLASMSAAIQGSRHTDETKAKISEKLRGRKRKRAAVWATARAHRGKKVSPATRKKLADAATGKVANVRTRKRMAKAKMGNRHKVGKIPTKKTRSKMSDALKAWWAKRKAEQAAEKLANEIFDL